MITNVNVVNDIISEDINPYLREAFFIDIETTGLSRNYSNIISITLLLFEDKDYKIYQIFCEYQIDELEALKLLKELINRKTYVITYNGNSFDIPFLINKFQKYNIDINFNNFIKIDLYSYIKKIKNKIQLEDLKLKTVEEYFKIKRHDTLSGKDIILLYEVYRIDPRKEFSYLIMQHNYEDVYNLPVLFENILNMYNLVFYYNDLIVMVNHDDIKIKKNSLYWNLNVITSFKRDYIHQSINFNLNIDSRAQSMILEVPLGFFNDDKITEFYFVNNDDYKVRSYTAIKGIKKNLIPIKFNYKIFYNNMDNLIKTILDSIFKSDL